MATKKKTTKKKAIKGKAECPVIKAVKLEYSAEQHFHHKHVRILREALAKMASTGTPLVSIYLNQQMREFARQIQPTCTCPERAFVDSEGKDACLFCGRRHDPKKKGHLTGL